MGMPDPVSISSASRARLYTTLDSPIGQLLLLGDERALSGLYMQAGRRPRRIAPDWEPSADAFAAVRAQLEEEYFAGERLDFESGQTCLRA
jgi:methylated-DNA-[protein]-cysteine S-methyltransferase